MSQNDEVQTMVLNALHWDLAVPLNRLTVEVEHGWVTMSGMVDRAYERACANPTRGEFLVWWASTIEFSSAGEHLDHFPLAFPHRDRGGMATMR